MNVEINQFGNCRIGIEFRIMRTAVIKMMQYEAEINHLNCKQRENNVFGIIMLQLKTTYRLKYAK